MLIDRLKDFGSAILVFTGGDPMMRRDLFDLITYATQKGLRCSLTPTATALPTPNKIKAGQQAGIRRIALSLDAPPPKCMMLFARFLVPGKGRWRILRNAQAVGLSAQVNTTVSTYNVHLLEQMVPFIKEVNAVQWSVFFLVPTGRAQVERMISARKSTNEFSTGCTTCRRLLLSI